MHGSEQGHDLCMAQSKGSAAAATHTALVKAHDSMSHTCSCRYTEERPRPVLHNKRKTRFARFARFVKRSTAAALPGADVCHCVQHRNVDLLRQIGAEA